MLVIAHRGASELAPENTLMALKLALDAGIEAIEFDIQAVANRAGDYELVAIHDRLLKRIAGLEGRVEDSSFEFLRALSLAENQQIPTLKEILKLAANYKYQPLINIEVKTEQGLTQVLNDIDYGIANLGISPTRILVSSFFHHHLKRLKQSHPQIKTGALIAHCPIDYASCAQELGCESVNVNVECVNKELVVDAHHRGLKVYVYTVDRRDDITNLMKLGVDGIFSNHPMRARDIISQLMMA